MKNRTSTLLIDDIPIAITRRKMKSLRLRVCPQKGEVKVSAPHFVARGDIHAFVVKNLEWVRSQRAEVANREVVPVKLMQTGDTIPLLGQPFSLRVEKGVARASLKCLADNVLLMRLPQGAGLADQQQLVDNWYRDQLKLVIPPLLERYEPQMGVAVKQWGIKKMKTRWGSCNITARRIWLNLDLASKPAQCLEYVVVHELAHLLESGHTPRFWAIVDKTMPAWRAANLILNPRSRK